MKSDNPLLDFTGLPRFSEIRPQHIEPALDYLLARNRRLIDGLVKQKVQPTWSNLMAPMEQLNDELERMWSPVSHLNSVRDSDALREAYQACLPKLTDYSAELGQNALLFARLQAILEADDVALLGAARKKAIENDIRDFRLSGIDLDADGQARYRQISRRLSSLGNRFSQNVLDATDAWTLHIEEADRLSGLPETAIALARSTAQGRQLDGWVFTLQAPSYIPFMTHADARDLREQMYSAYVTRASDQGPCAGQWDNTNLICETLKLRQELAQLLGFETYAHYSLATKMATSPQQVETFLQDLADKSMAAGRQEVGELGDFARKNFGLQSLAPWDYAYMSDKLKLQRFAFSDESLRPYFPLPKVLEGMFAIVGRLFGIHIRETAVDQVWNDQVQMFEIHDEQGAIRGRFYLDLFARSEKCGGAWMADCMSRRQSDQGIQIPVAFLTCNFTEPLGEQPSLLTHDEVMTLFHEFGHGLHHMLTQVDVAAVSGISGVPWDAVELPSQFLENWCWQRESLDMIAEHHETGEPLADELLEKMRAAKNFQSAMQMLRQVEFSLFDFRLHQIPATEISPAKVRSVLADVRKQVAVVETPGFNRFENTFGHIFAGGYAAGYYSYKWAEVLSADAFSLFEERGLFDEQTARAFLTAILETGGTEDPEALFVRFRGRKPEINALLRHSGLA